MVYSQFTLADLQLQLAEKWENSVFWSAEEARLALNEAFRVWNMFTGVWKQTVSFVTPFIGQSPWIATPSPLMYVTRMNYNGSPLGRSSIGDLDNGRPGWEAESISSGGDVPNVAKVYAPAGLSMFAIWPYDNIGGNSLDIEGVVAAPQLVNSSDSVDINNASIGVVLGYALHVASLKEGGRRWLATQQYYKDFLLAAVDQNDRLATSSFFRKALGLDINRGQRPLRVGLADQQRQSAQN